MLQNPEKESIHLLTPEGLAERGEFTRVFKAGAKTERAERIGHPENEDSMLMIPDKKFAAVFDGMGGMAAGAQASRLAQETIAKELRQIPEDLSPEKWKQVLADSLGAASDRIRDEVRQYPEKQGMGTTATMAKILEYQGERRAIIAQVGDSRAYLVRKSGEVVSITIDDAIWRQEDNPAEAKKIQEKFSHIQNQEDLAKLAPPEQFFWSRRHVLSQAVAGEPLRVGIYETPLAKGERILLTSDGIHDVLSDPELSEFFQSATASPDFHPRYISEKLVELARQQARDPQNIRAKEDDRTAVILDPDAPEFQYHQQVRVQRTAGNVEHDWKISKILREEQGYLQARVIKQDRPGHFLQKDVKIDDLRTLNPR